MSDDLVRRAREFRRDWSVLSDERGMASVLIAEMADRIEELERDKERLVAFEYSAALYLKEAAAGARREALEEAARVADDYSGDYAGAGAAWDIAAAIRALKEKE
jgi:hypothetical protein